MMESDPITVYGKNIATIYLKPIIVDHTLNFLNFIGSGLVYTEFNINIVEPRISESPLSELSVIRTLS